MKTLALLAVLSGLLYLILTPIVLYDMYDGYDKRSLVLWSTIFEGIWLVLVGGVLYYLVSGRRQV